MSPSKVIVLHRWQVVAAFAAVTAAFVVATVVATNASDTAHGTAVQARALSLQNQKTLRREDVIRAELVRKIHRQDVVNCRRLRDENHVIRDAIRRGVRMTRAELDGPTAQLPGVRAILLSSIRESRLLLRKLRGADCKGVPRLAPPPKLDASP